MEKLWHLFVPPVMTLLDDYEAKYKLQGVELVSQLLEASPPDVLRRTGIDSLMLHVSTQFSKCSASTYSSLVFTVAQNLLGIPSASGDPESHSFRGTNKYTIDRAHYSGRVRGSF